MGIIITITSLFYCKYLITTIIEITLMIKTIIIVIIIIIIINYFSF